MKFSAALSLLAFVGGFILAVFGFYHLNRYGTPNPAFAISFILKRDFWILFVGILISLIGAASYYWISSPPSSFKEFIQSLSPLAAISIVLSSTSLFAIPISRLIGPWDIFEGLFLGIATGLVLLISFTLSLMSIPRTHTKFFSYMSVLWCIAAGMIVFRVHH